MNGKFYMVKKSVSDSFDHMVLYVKEINAKLQVIPHSKWD